MSIFINVSDERVTTEGVHKATLTEVTQIERPQWGNDGIKFLFELENGKELHRITGTKPTQNSLLRQFAENLLGSALPDRFDLETLVGTEVLVTVENVQRGNKVYSNIVFVQKEAAHA